MYNIELYFKLGSSHGFVRVNANNNLVYFVLYMRLYKSRIYR